MGFGVVVSWLFMFILAVGALTYENSPTAFVTVPTTTNEPIIGIMLAIIAIACLLVATKKR